MRRIEHLINDVKFSTNEDSNRFPNLRFNKLFNEAQDEIQRIVHTSNTNTKFFAGEEVIDLISNQELYPLPSTIYTENSVSSVSIGSGDGRFGPLPQIGLKERSRSFGYIIQGSDMLISPIPQSSIVNGIRINFVKKLPTLSVRVGRVLSINGGMITMSGTDDVLSIDQFSDYFCIVDKNGATKDQGLFIDSATTTSIATSSSIVNGVAGDYVVAGEYATTNPLLPDGTEKFLTSYVERQVHYINSNGRDLSASKIFTDEEKSDIINLFSHNEKDTKYPEIVDTGYFYA